MNKSARQRDLHKTEEGEFPFQRQPHEFKVLYDTHGGGKKSEHQKKRGKQDACSRRAGALICSKQHVSSQQ